MESESSVPRLRIIPRKARRFGTVLLVLALSGYMGISVYSAHVLTSPHNRESRIDPRFVAPDAVAWSTTTEDGLTLRGWYFPTETHRRLVVLVHGLWEGWDVLAGQARDLHHRGYDVLAFDLRGHGQSDPARLTMGRSERRDLRAAQEWARRQGFTPDRIGWVGYSLGGATLLMEAETNPAIRVAVIDSPFGNLPEVLDEQLAAHSGLPRVFNPGILLAAWAAFGTRTDDLIPIRSARHWGSRPLLLIHGQNDQLVPVSQAKRLARAAGSTCRAVLLPGVGHVDAYQRDPIGYIARLDLFFRKHLQP